MDSGVSKTSSQCDRKAIVASCKKECSLIHETLEPSEVDT